MNTHYTYYILGIAENIWKDQWYIGSRTATHGRTPEEDIGIRYFTTSSNDDFVAQFKAHPEWFVCTILERGYPDVRTMQDDEERRITESWNVTGRINRKARLPLFERDERYQETMRTMRESPEWREKNAAANRKRSQDPVWREKNAAGARKRSQDPVWREKNAATARKLALDPVHQETMRKVRESPEYKANHAAAMHKLALDPVWREKNAAANRKMHESPEWREKNAAANRKKAQDPEFGKKLSEGKKRARAARVKSLFS